MADDSDVMSGVKGHLTRKFSHIKIKMEKRKTLSVIFLLKALKE